VLGRGVSLPSGGGVGEGTGTQVPLSSRFPLGQVQTGPLGLSRQSHSHFLRSQGLVTGGMGGWVLSLLNPVPWAFPPRPLGSPFPHLQAAYADGTGPHQRHGSGPLSG
jgi:hypothetical protein